MTRNLRYYVEREPGLLVRLPPEEFYPRELVRQAAEMGRHYRRLWNRPEVAGLRDQVYGSVLAWGGGLPHFEVGMCAMDGCIAVWDRLAALYRPLESVWREEWRLGPAVRWQDAALFAMPDLQGVECVSFSHVLEHVSLSLAAHWLASVPAAADIVIYQPNADCCTEDTALHLRPVHEHVWLGSLEWTRAWAEKATGRTAAIALAHDEDLLLYLPAAGRSPEAFPVGHADLTGTPDWGCP